MANDLRIVVLERGSALTHELTLACVGTRIDVLGPMHALAEVSAARQHTPIDVVVAEHAGAHAGSVRDAVDVLVDSRILVMCDSSDPAITAAVVSLGATGVLQRGAGRRVLVDAIRRAAAGELIAPAAHLPALLELSGLARPSDLPSGRVRTLTRREREVLTLLADGRTTGEIAGALSISALTVQSHVKNILAKLGVHSKVEAIRYGWRSGALEISIGA
jgi:DNA-binding NarL/FixJ family response regulator